MTVNLRVFISSVIFLFSMVSAHAGSSNSLKNIEFSSPDTMANVGKDFSSRAIKYGDKVGDVDVVISLGQQTYPALHKVVEEIALKQGIKVDIQKGSCGSTAKKLLKKSVDIATYCCPTG